MREFLLYVAGVIWAFCLALTAPAGAETDVAKAPARDPPCAVAGVHQVEDTPALAVVKSGTTAHYEGWCQPFCPLMLLPALPI